MNKSLFMVTLGVLTSFLLVAQETKQEDTATSVFEAARKSRLSVNLRFGYEYSTLDNTLSPGQNLSLRTRIGFETAKYQDTKLFVQSQLVNNLIEEHTFTGGGDVSRDGIGDVDGMRIHQAYLENTSLHKTLVRAGRQEIILDDARLIGNIGWRQFAQSFDGALLTNTCVDNVVLSLAWVDSINTINNTTVDLKNLGIINAKYSSDLINLSLFSYLLDAKTGNRDSITYGTRADGNVGLFDYDITLAQQEDFANGNGHNGYMTNYYGGGNVGQFHIGAGYSRISGARGTNGAFDTLFSTAHKFNGWADQFLATNGGGLTAGLQDSYIDVTTKVMDTVVLLRYHSFRTTEDGPGATHSGDYGDELDLMLKRSFKIADSNSFDLIIQFALYNETNQNGGTNPTADEFLTSIRMQYTF
ncbi:hypothetical protein BVX99_02290 [bacterium F16]|nr:hypothetical protein BVX99_02290 [bacterium F16]